jgi:hypothetical protein
LNLPRLNSTLLLRICICCGAAIVLATLWGRAGVLPAASAGDDIWFNEAGYYLMTDGVLREPMHDDAIGSATRDFVPPIPAVFMAAAFSIFGLTQFADGCPGALAMTVTFFLLAVVVRRVSGLSYVASLAAAMAVLFLPQFIRLTYQNRYECYVMLFLSLSLLFGSTAASGRWTQAAAIVLSGLCAGAACAAHYAVAPYVWGLAALVVHVAHGRKALLPFAIGTLAAGLIGVAWVWPDFGLFFRQAYALRNNFDLYWMFGSVDAFIFAKRDALCILALAVAANAVSPFSARRIFLWCAAVGAVLGIFWWHSLPLYASVSLIIGIAVIAGSDARESDKSWRQLSARSIAAAVLALLFSATVAANVAVAATAVREWKERDFSAFKENLRTVLKGHLAGLVLIDRTPHLALREIVPSGRLHHLVGHDQTLIFASRVLFDASAEPKVSALVVVPEALDQVMRDFPLARSFVQDVTAKGDKPVELSALGIGGPLARRGPYRVLVYTRAR